MSLTPVLTSTQLSLCQYHGRFGCYTHAEAYTRRHQVLRHTRCNSNRTISTNLASVCQVFPLSTAAVSIAKPPLLQRAPAPDVHLCAARQTGVRIQTLLGNGLWAPQGANQNENHRFTGEVLQAPQEAKQTENHRFPGEVLRAPQDGAGREWKGFCCSQKRQPP